MERLPTPEFYDDDEFIMHQRFELWLDKHEVDHRGIIERLPYDRQKFPSQRIEEAKSTALALRADDDFTSSRYTEKLRDFMAHSMGDNGEPNPTKVARFAADFQDLEINQASNQSYSNFIAQKLNEGRRIGIICDHGQDLGDIGKAAGALCLAISDERQEFYGPRFNIWVNKLMTRENYMGHPVEYLLGMSANIRWVIPDSQTAAEFGFTPNDPITNRVNKGALRSFLHDKKQGSVEAFVPGGSAMTKVIDPESGKVFLQQKPISPATLGLIGMMDYLVPVSVWQNNWEISEIINLRQLNLGQMKKPAKQSLLLNIANELSRKQGYATERLSNIPVRIARY